MFATATGCQIRLLCAADIPFAMSLTNEAGWNQVERDWRHYLALEPQGCFLAQFDGRRVGTAITIRYDNRIGWIGMVLVQRAYRSIGIGTCLVNHCIQYLQSHAVETIKLDATSVGKRIYLHLGFQEEYEVYLMQGQCKISTAPVFPSPDRYTTDRLVEYDMEAFGANRSRVLRKLAEDSPALTLVSHITPEHVTGYIFARPGYEAYQIGPWVANSPMIAQNLFTAMLSKLSGHRVLLDIPLSNRVALSIVENYGFIVQRSFTRMFVGPNRYRGLPHKIYATSSAEKG